MTERIIIRCRSCRGYALALPDGEHACRCSPGISYEQIRFVVDSLHKNGFHIVPATEETTKAALPAHEVEKLFHLA